MKKVILGLVMLVCGVTLFAVDPLETRLETVLNRMLAFKEYAKSKGIDFSVPIRMLPSTYTWAEVVKDLSRSKDELVIGSCEIVEYSAGAPTYSYSYYSNPKKLTIKYGNTTVPMLWYLGGFMSTDTSNPILVKADPTLKDGYKGAGFLLLDKEDNVWCAPISSLQEVVEGFEEILAQLESQWAENHPNEPLPF